jgi:hypothetical protein
VADDGLTWHGDEILEAITESSDRGLRLGGEVILATSSRYVPHETGDLSRSGEVSVEPGKVAISYDRPYAVRQHEDMTAKHDDGRRAKYLEKAAHDEGDTVLALLARELGQGLNG